MSSPISWWAVVGGMREIARCLGLINLSRLRGKLFSRLTSHHSGIRHRTDDVESHTKLDRDSHITIGDY